MQTRVDHLVVVCRDLDQGARWCEKTLGVPSQPGGRHLTMGTHNRLLRLGARAYLELIALDPEGTAPARPRWFNLDDPAVRERAIAAPFLHTWVAATDDIEAAIAAVPALGQVQPFTRNQLAWRFALRDDGQVNFDGALPSLIQWDSALHPCDVLADQQCKLTRLRFEHPRAQALRDAFDQLGLLGPIEVMAGPLALVAEIATPAGTRVISSRT